VLGRVNTVFPERSSRAGDTFKVTVDDNVGAVIEWPNNTLATMRANWCSPSDHRNVICETRIYGTAGIIFINPASKTDTIVAFSPDRAIEGATPIAYNGMTNCYRPALALWDGDQEILRSFSEQIGDGGSVKRNWAASAARQRQVIEIIDKLYASSKTGSALKLEPE
jgi:predicted dehydrogenase